MKLFRFLRMILLAFVLIVGVAAVAIGFLANRTLKAAVESAGTKALNVGVRVDDVDLSVRKGKISLENLTIDNPPGYQHDKLLELNRIDVLLDAKSLLEDVVNITHITLDSGNVVIEQRGVSGNNLQDIIEKLPEEDPEPTGKKLHIDILEVTNAEVKVKLLPIPGKLDTLSFKLAPIKLTDLGGENGFDSVALTRVVLLAIAGKIAEQGAGVLPDEMLGSLVSELSKLEALPAALIKMLGIGVDFGTGAGKGIGEGVLKGAEDIGKGISEGMKAILGQKKKED